MLLPVILSCRTEKEPITVKPTPVDSVIVNNAYDIVVYGATPAGIISGIQASKLGKSVIIISNSNRIGGMCTGGLSTSDIGNYRVIGGLCLDFFKKIGEIYQGKNIPVWEFEAEIALQAFNSLLESNKVKVLYNERIDLTKGVVKDSLKIKSIITESGKVIMGKMFIDASYEGDLMALSGVKFIIGRESENTYGESLNGFLKKVESWQVDPYIEEGNPASGLLPQITSTTSGLKGAGDLKTQAYNFRVCMTNDPLNRVNIEKPDDYKDLDYELLIRTIQKQPNYQFWSIVPILNRKVDVNNNSFPSLDYVGMNFKYITSTYAEREKSKQKHENYIRGLIWTLQNSPKIPSSIRDIYKPFGLAKDEFKDNNNWPTEFYVREGRRMIGKYVMTQANILDGKKIDKPIGMGSYAIDSHGVEFLVSSSKKVVQEGSIFVKVARPYPISYESIIPASGQCENLLVPVCLSASHVAFCSIRMEPQFMILGQAAATAASLCIDMKSSVQNLDYKLLSQRLINDNQILTMN